MQSYAPSIQVQQSAAWRCRKCRRYPNYTVGRLVVATITALICGITWWGEGSLPDGPAEVSTINNLVGSLYASLAFMGAPPTPPAACTCVTTTQVEKRVAPQATSQHDQTKPNRSCFLQDTYLLG